MSDKEKIIFLANELISQGYEIIELVLNDSFIDYSFRAEKLNQILQSFKSMDKFTVKDIRDLYDLIREAYNQGDGNV